MPLGVICVFAVHAGDSLYGAYPLLDKSCMYSAWQRVSTLSETLVPQEQAPQRAAHLERGGHKGVHRRARGVVKALDVALGVHVDVAAPERQQRWESEHTEPRLSTLL